MLLLWLFTLMESWITGQCTLSVIAKENISVYFLSWSSPPYHFEIPVLPEDNPKGERITTYGIIPKVTSLMFEEINRFLPGQGFQFNFTKHQKQFQNETELFRFINIEQSTADILAGLGVTSQNETSDVYIIGSTTKLGERFNPFFTRTSFLNSEKQALVVPIQDLYVVLRFVDGLENCLSTLLIAIVCSINVAFLIWIIEHRSNEEFDAEVGPGIWSAIWFCLVTMTTVGYGDKAPRHFLSRLICLAWMICGMMMTAFITATIVEAMSKGLSKEDKQIAVLENSMAMYVLPNKVNGIPKPVESHIDALEMVRSDEATKGALVDVEVAAYHLKNNPNYADLKIESEYDIETPIFIYLAQTGKPNQRLTTLLAKFALGNFDDFIIQGIKSKFTPSYNVYPYYSRKLGAMFTEPDVVSATLFICAAIVILVGLVSELSRLVKKNRNHGVEHSVGDNRQTRFEDSAEFQSVQMLEKQFKGIIEGQMKEAKEKYNKRLIEGRPKPRV
ncbi:uncharacterized protein [Clytia hemisphaerica]|uniref:uncharacterized protein n=1 Tax=Clytia hemisphaerica TaxID=252671 RepID=UPI0034D59CD2